MAHLPGELPLMRNVRTGGTCPAAFVLGIWLRHRTRKRFGQGRFDGLLRGPGKFLQQPKLPRRHSRRGLSSDGRHMIVPGIDGLTPRAKPALFEGGLFAPLDLLQRPQRTGDVGCLQSLPAGNPLRGPRPW